MSLNDVALEVLGRQRAKHPVRVFTYKGGPITQVNTKAWRNALRRAGIGNFRWHDLRHSWASWLIQHGTPLYDLQEMGGWKSAAMVRRYAHLAPAQMARHAAVVGGLLTADLAELGVMARRLTPMLGRRGHYKADQYPNFDMQHG